jgi:hypothetical protein
MKVVELLIIRNFCFDRFSSFDMFFSLNLGQTSSFDLGSTPLNLFYYINPGQYESCRVLNSKKLLF